jgi:hypothetical protein
MNSDSSDNEKYQLKILNIALFVPVAQLAAPVFQELNSIMTRKNDPQTIGIHYRRIEVRPFNLVPNNEEYNSGTLFTDSDLPCKIVICFVKTKSKNGDYFSNPFEMRRSWNVPSNLILQPTLDLNQKSDREIALERRVQEMEREWRSFRSSLETTTSKGKGRGKKSTNSKKFDEEVAKEAEKRLRAFIQSQQEPIASGSRSSEHSFPVPSAPPMPDNWTEDNSSIGGNSFATDQASTTNVFIKKVEVTLNGVPIDQVNL